MRNLAEAIDEQATIEQAIANFSALIDDLDFTGELDLLGIGRFQFLRRKQMIIELRGLYTALWRLALARSFPHDADSMFEVFLERYGRTHTGKLPVQIMERARQYWGMLEPAGDGDFSVVARHLSSFTERDDKARRPLILKLALHIRRAYRFIFERLI